MQDNKVNGNKKDEGTNQNRERERERGMTGISMFLTFTGIVGEMDEA